MKEPDPSTSITQWVLSTWNKLMIFYDLVLVLESRKFTSLKLVSTSRPDTKSPNIAYNLIYFTSISILKSNLRHVNFSIFCWKIEDFNFFSFLDKSNLLFWFTIRWSSTLFIFCSEFLYLFIKSARHIAQRDPSKLRLYRIYSNSNRIRSNIYWTQAVFVLYNPKNIFLYFREIWAIFACLNLVTPW